MRIKTISSILVVAITTVMAIIPPTRCGAADEVVAFGLTNRSIHSATVFLDPDYRELRVTNLSTLGYKGVSVQLGQADSGLFFSPYVRASIEDNNFMIGHAYGRVGGIHRRLSSVFCRRDGWANYPVTVDFLPLGSVSKTVQIFVDHVLVGEETYTSGAIAISTSNSDSLGPRVNPFWRAPDGSVGVLLEFSGSTPPITLPSGRYGYADRIFIRANQPLFAVDYVSHVDIYGGGGLPEFSGLDERLGMFGRPHRALGGAVFAAKKNKLAVNGCDDAGTDGVLIELAHAPSFDAQFQPVSLASNGAIFQVSATESYDYIYHRRPGNYFGPLGLENIAGEKMLRVDAPGADSLETRVEIFDGAVRSGEFVTTNSGLAGSFGTNDLEIIGAGVSGGVDEQPAVLQLLFHEPATFTRGALVLRGDKVRLSPVNPTNDIGTFVSFQVLVCGVGSFTITNESAAVTPPISLGIEHTGTNVFVSWPVFALRVASFETNRSLASRTFWNTAYGPSLPLTRSRIQTRFPFNPTGNNFFRLYNPYARFFEPFTPD